MENSFPMCAGFRPSDHQIDDEDTLISAVAANNTTSFVSTSEFPMSDFTHYSTSLPLEPIAPSLPTMDSCTSNHQFSYPQEPFSFKPESSHAVRCTQTQDVRLSDTAPTFTHSGPLPFYYSQRTVPNPPREVCAPSDHPAFSGVGNANDDSWLMPVTRHANVTTTQQLDQVCNSRTYQFPRPEPEMRNNSNELFFAQDISVDHHSFIIAQALNEDTVAPSHNEERFVKPEDELYPFVDFSPRIPSPVLSEITLPQPPMSTPLPSAPNFEPFQKTEFVAQNHTLCYDTVPKPETIDFPQATLELSKSDFFSQNNINTNLLTNPGFSILPPQVAEPSQQILRNSPTLSPDLTSKDANSVTNDLITPSLSSTEGLLKSSYNKSEGMKPINTLGSACFAGFYLVTLTRTLIRNHTVPLAVRRAFLAPQIHFGFTVRDQRDGKYRHVHTVQIPYDALNTAGEWLRVRLGISKDACTFKQLKDTLQRCLTNAWGKNNWTPLVHRFQTDFGKEFNAGIDDALRSEAVVGRGFGTPRQFFHLLNCHKGAPDIRRDVDGAISARESLRWILSELGLNVTGSDVAVARFRDDIFPLWKHHCAYVREHSVPNCCSFYCGGYFKKIMTHRHLYDVDGCLSAYHVKDLFEGLEEVIKVWSNPTGMCVREAKCAAGLRYNVDKSFQSGIRSYAKAKFLEAAPHTALEITSTERRLHQQVQSIVWLKTKKFAKCRRALREIEIRTNALGSLPVPEALSSQDPGYSPTGNVQQSQGMRKRKRQEREQDHDVDTTSLDIEAVAGIDPPTPREQKRKHAHLSLKRKEAMELQVKEYLDAVREECTRQESLLDEANGHGENCDCQSVTFDDVSLPNRYLTSNTTPVA